MDPDEGRYAEIAREMLVLKDWLIPHLNLLPYLEKPPLVYWLTALGFKVFGYTEAAARLPSAVSALGGVFLAYGLGRALWGPLAGILGALVLASTRRLRGPGPHPHPGHDLCPVPEPGDRPGIPGPEPGPGPAVALGLSGPGPGGPHQGAGGAGAGGAGLGQFWVVSSPAPALLRKGEGAEGQGLLQPLQPQPAPIKGRK